MATILAEPRVEAAGRDLGPRPAGQFDYYVLSLSWVPGFCATHRTYAAECVKGLGFALHGLWPQLNGGDYPTNCGVTPLRPADVQAYQALYPDPSMIGREWRRHGTCSGLPPDRYFALAARDRRRIRLPAPYDRPSTLAAVDANLVRSALIAANPGLRADGMTTVQIRGLLTQVEICLTRSGDFRPC